MVNAHRYWKMTNITLSDGVSFGGDAAIAEVWLRNTPGGSDLAATLSASSQRSGNEPDKANDGNNATFWRAGFAGWYTSDSFVFDLGSPQVAAEMRMVAPAAGGSRAPRKFDWYWSDDAIIWRLEASQIQFAVNFGDGQQQLLQFATAAVPEVRDTQASLMAVYNIPAEEIRIPQATAMVAYRLPAQELRTTQAALMVVSKGKVTNPRLKAWWFTLDDHDFFVLKLGTDAKTLVFDLTTSQWAWWASGLDVRWRASTGMNWSSAGSIPKFYGSNVVVGDDSAGILWVLDPSVGVDDSAAAEGATSPFERVATGQVPARGRGYEPIWGVDLSASVGYPSFAGATVTLEYSDDQGRSYVEAEEPLESVDGENLQFTWGSLGQMTAPGRLFRVRDMGAFARLDDLVINGNED